MAGEEAQEGLEMLIRSFCVCCIVPGVSFPSIIDSLLNLQIFAMLYSVENWLEITLICQRNHSRIK